MASGPTSSFAIRYFAIRYFAMKQTTTAVINLINAAIAAPDAPIAFAECFTFITTAGSQYTWTNVDYDITYNGFVFRANGPLVSGLKYKGAVGLEVDKQQITIAAPLFRRHQWRALSH